MLPEDMFEQIFHRLLATPAAQRATLAVELCPDQEEALKLLEMVDAAQSMGDLQEVPYPEPGKRFQNYDVIRELGAGGMGIVYLAEEVDLHRFVAIKVVRSDIVSDEIHERFVAEQRALAQLSHRNIARLYHAEITEDGLPFYVMEYVEGITINRYCNEKGLTISDRLRLFREVCDAVHFVHIHTVIHRDLKPSNIFVTNDGDVKLLDFGLAKSLVEGVGGQTIGTNWRTPVYASPEQVNELGLSTQSDQWSLGVLLYQLLTGTIPFRGVTATEIQDRVRHDEPVLPSTCVLEAGPREEGDGISREASEKLEELSDALALGRPEAGVEIDENESQRDRAARLRQTTPELLAKRLRGDLDNILRKCLEKEPARRYPSVDQLSEDIGRHLKYEPVVAQALTWSYRAGKFLRRYRIQAIAVGAAVLLAMIATISVLWEARIARLERSRAEHRFNDVRHLANAFLFDFYGAIEGVPGTTAAQELIVSRGKDYLDSLVEESPGPDLKRNLAAAYERVGDVEGQPYAQSLGRSDAALQSYKRSLALREQLPASASSRFDLAKSHFKIADVLWVERQWELANQNYEAARQIDESLLRADPAIWR